MYSRTLDVMENSKTFFFNPSLRYAKKNPEITENELKKSLALISSEQ